ncbi:unnamed protein product [Parnassius mnemosyne]|uniref:Uncharacterized protein n=1 Tax=Parnassius mnemosyne TaxID=213953 RepID=A0AAV1LRB0_9NEOP
MKNVKPTIVTLAVLHNIAIGQDSVPDHDDELNQLWMLNFYLKLVGPEEETPIMLFYEHLLIGILTN